MTPDRATRKPGPPQSSVYIEGATIDTTRMRTTRGLLLLGCLGVGAFGATVQACGSDSSNATPHDASADSPSDAAPDDSAPADASPEPHCLGPSNSSKSSLCVRVAPEAIQFLANNPDLDGKGILAFDIHDAPNPDAPDGAPLPALQAVILPGLDAGEVDISLGVPAIRFDGLPTTVYPRVIFVDARNTPRPTAGWWFGGYDLANGLAGTILLKPVTLTPGQGTTITLDLTALRRLSVTISSTATPIGNGMGAASVLVVPDVSPSATSKIFGSGASACAKVNGGATSVVGGFVMGKGPYYTVAQLDDFGAGGVLPPGALSSLVPKS